LCEFCFWFSFRFCLRVSFRFWFRSYAACKPTEAQRLQILAHALNSFSDFALDLGHGFALDGFALMNLNLIGTDEQYGLYCIEIQYQ
jgi:hypothetical protein